MYYQFGVDPWNPRQIGYVPFTPLQVNPYSVPRVQSCQTCESSVVTGNAIVSQTMPVAPSVVPVAPGESDISISGPAPTEPASTPESNIDPENTISSPSDIVLTPGKSDEPTLAGDARNEPDSELENAQSEISQLKTEIAELKKQGRVAMERAYAAEKAAIAAKSSAEETMERMKKEQRLKAADEASVRSTAQLKKIAALENKLRNLQEMADQKKDNPAPAKASSPKSEAQKRLDKLRADAETASQPQKKKPSPPKMKTDDQPSKQKSDQPKDKKPTKPPIQQQIKNLEAATERQIKNSTARIRKRNQAAIKKLIDGGQENSDPEVQALKAKMEAEIEENAAKIRQRAQERLKRLRKEAAARAIS